MQWNDRTAAHATHVFTVTGDVSATSLRQLRPALSRLIQQGGRSVVVDLSGVARFNWTGLRVIAGLRLSITGRGGAFNVAGGSSVRRAVAHYQVEHALGLFATPGKAVLGCAPEPFLRPGQSVCDWCGAVTLTRERINEVVRDSSSEHAGDPLLEGTRMVVGCSQSHVTALIHHYGARPYNEVEVWASRIDGIIEDKGETFNGPALADEAGLDFDQLQKAMSWRAGYDM